MVGQPGKAGTEEHTEEFGFITKEYGTRVRVISDTGAFLITCVFLLQISSINWNWSIFL